MYFVYSVVLKKLLLKKDISRSSCGSKKLNDKVHKDHNEKINGGSVV